MDVRILMVEDDPDDALLLQKSLCASEAEFHVTTVPTVREGRAALGREEFDAWIVDYRLPDGTGLDLLERAERRHPDVPVIVCSGVGDERLAVRSIQHGAVEYFSKDGLPRRDLADIILEALERRRGQAAPAPRPRPARTRAAIDLRPGQHVLHAYASSEERDEFLGSFLEQGLYRGEKALLVSAGRSREQVAEALRTAGLAVDVDVGRGRLVLVEHDDWLGRTRDPMMILARLTDEIDAALSAGCRALRVSYESPRPWDEWERWHGLDVHAAMNDLLPAARCLVVCQAPIGATPPSILADLLESHPEVVGRRAAVPNPYHVPAGQRKAAEWLDRLREWEETRDRLAWLTREMDRHRMLCGLEERRPPPEG